MKTDALIEALARNVQPARRSVNWPRLAAACLVGALVAGVAAWFVFGVRPDAGAAMNAVLLKTLYSAAIVSAAAPLAFVLAQPNTGVGRWAWPAMGAVALSLGLAAAALVMSPPGDRMTAWLAGETLPKCLLRVPVLAAPVLVALMFAARGLAPTRLTLAGAALGGLAGAVGAIAYSWVCMVDSPPYVATWYLVSILACAGAGALLGRWMLRW